MRRDAQGKRLLPPPRTVHQAAPEHLNGVLCGAFCTKPVREMEASKVTCKRCLHRLGLGKVR